MLNVIRLIRNLHSDTVIIVDDYKNYYIYDNDVFVVYYLLNFSIKKYNGNMFIRNDLNYLHYLISKLRENNINYIVVVKRCGYNVEQQVSFDNNNYKTFWLKGRLYHKRRKVINDIVSKLKIDVFKNRDKISLIRKMIDEIL